MDQHAASDQAPVSGDALHLERVFARGWPGLEQEWHGDWLLRSGHGFTGRANSALVLGRPGSALPQAVEQVEDWYAARGLPARFQVPDGSVAPIDPAVGKLDDHLAGHAWRRFDDVAVLVAEVRTARALLPPRRSSAPAIQVSIDSRPDPTWLALYEYRGKPLLPSAIEVLMAGTSPYFVTLHVDGDAVAVTRGAVTDEWLGITAVTVPARFRRRGFGTAALAAAMDHGETLGAESVYLQVSRDNAGALALYAGLGFVEHHGYHYWDAPEARTR